MAFNRKLSSRGVNINQLEQKEVYVGGKPEKSLLSDGFQHRMAKHNTYQYSFMWFWDLKNDVENVLKYVSSDIDTGWLK